MDEQPISDLSVEDVKTVLKEPETQSRQCVAFNKKGERCKAWALRDGELCPAHAGVTTQNLDPHKGAAASAESRRQKEKERAKDLLEILHEKIQQRAPDLVDVAINKALDGDSRTLEMLLNRVYGKPTARIETTAEITENVNWGEKTPEERAAYREELLKRARNLHSRFVDVDEADSDDADDE